MQTQEKDGANALGIRWLIISRYEILYEIARVDANVIVVLRIKDGG